MAKRLISVLLLFIIADIYFYQALLTLTSNTFWHTLYWMVDGVVLLGLMALLVLRRKGKPVHNLVQVAMSGMLLVYVPKLFSFPLLFLEDITRMFRSFPARNIYISEAVVFIAVIVFIAIVFGLTRGKHFYKIKKQTLYFTDLPKAFDGFTITQLSDIHAGSLRNSKAVDKGIALANAQRSDLVLFTGDFVNNMANEVKPWLNSFAALEAPFGKYSILGNHDYGDYIRWQDSSAKAQNLRHLGELQADMGFKLLLNEAVFLQKGQDKIALIGVENWGKGGFQQYGDLKKATALVPDNSFKILMSHDPSHWEAETVNHRQHIHLTLAGHTHGMQFGVELFGYKWSPIQYFYKQWAGLYNKGGKYLYVNRGFGFHGMQGRVGIWPEITVLTLKRVTEKSFAPLAS
ncbi:metallophosphoesterase [Sphingobacterium oryzagri]|uniref:Metallophosphoesterase n=1 Tax=Sphingobacterium oryzagri TaxID=3025669 RepID=A0ABY7WLR7_9SPHI|nr:metallophosphoesterase [Sphingobacterium sp. KACC 22765]WDF70519.1 metallophosphoesterase [Sphingobacterium sp. KACC 22765]